MTYRVPNLFDLEPVEEYRKWMEEEFEYGLTRYCKML